MKKCISVLLSILLIFSMSAIALAANPVEAGEEWLTDWNIRENVNGKSVLTPGKDEFSRTFTWRSDTDGARFAYGQSRYLNAMAPADVKTSCSVTGKINTVTLNDLAPGTYYYAYTADKALYGIYSFEISATDNGFSAVLVSDPQLGRSGEDSLSAIQNDTYGWCRTLEAASGKNIDLVLSTGDQVNDGNSVLEYSALLSPSELRQLPIAAAAGNHDFYSPLYSMYFNNPNSTANDYYFVYGNVLFVVIDSNFVSVPVHEKTLNFAQNAYPDCDFTVVMMHHSVYSVNEGDPSNAIACTGLANLFDEYNVDLVLSGHDHIYARSVPLTDGKENLSGVIYLESGSASGGKCSKVDSVPSYTAYTENLSEASYTVLTFTSDAISGTTYTTDSARIADSFTITKDTGSTSPAGTLFARLMNFLRWLISYIPSLLKF